VRVKSGYVSTLKPFVGQGKNRDKIGRTSQPDNNVSHGFSPPHPDPLPHGGEGMPCGDFFGLLDKQCCVSLLNPPFPLYTGAACNHSPRLARGHRVPPR
jgi:hypothetical protein